MANKLYLKEFESMPTISGNAAQIWSEPASAFQSMAIDATHREITFGAKTKYICMTSDLNVAHLVSAAGTAAVSTTDFPLWANTYLSFAVQPGHVLSGVLWA